MKSSRPTLKDVAERSGFALRTVKKVFSGNANVRESTRTRVLAAAEELNYTRNRAASALARNRTVRIAVVYSVTSEAYFPEVQLGFDTAQNELKDFGLELEFLCGSDDDWHQQYDILKKLLDRDDLDGVILQPISSTHLNDLINALMDQGKPVVTFGADAPGSSRLCYVGPDAYKSGRIGGQILANYIGKQGRICLINLVVDHSQTRERCRGFMDRVKEHYPGISVFERDVPRNGQGYYDAVKKIVLEEDVTGLFCTDANTVIAARVLRDLNRHDVSLFGFDLSPSGAQLMHDGFIRVLIEQKPENFSHLATAIIYQHIMEGITPPEINNTPLYIVTSECL